MPNLSRGVRAEFARGDGRVKRKEDERRKNIAPSETLFVVNFHEETTKREDLEMLFEPFGELVRIDMKRNYAFVQFKTIAQATKAKETTNGGKLDQSVLTVEYVARQRENEIRAGGDRHRGGGGGGGVRGSNRDGPFREGGGGGGGNRHDDRRRSDDRRRPDDRPPGRDRGNSNNNRDRAYDDRGGRGSRSDDRYGGRRRDSPPPYRGGSSSRRSRSRSPAYGRNTASSRSPPPTRRYNSDDREDYRGRGSDTYNNNNRDRAGGNASPPDYHRGRAPSPGSPIAPRRGGASPDRYNNRSSGGGDRDVRGYRN